MYYSAMYDTYNHKTLGNVIGYIFSSLFLLILISDMVW